MIGAHPETESLREIDSGFIEAMIARLRAEAVTDPQLVKTAPHLTRTQQSRRSDSAARRTDFALETAAGHVRNRRRTDA